MFLFRLPLVMVACIVAGLASAQGDGTALVDVQGAPSVATVHAGERFMLAFTFRIEPDWHIYWANPGDTGTPTEINVTAPEGYKVGSIIWGRPKNIPGPFTTYGYEGQVTMFVPVAAPKELSSGEATFSASINWLVCKQQCFMGEADLTIQVATAPEALPQPARGDARSGRTFDDRTLAQEFRRTPRRLKRVKRATMEAQGSTVVVTGPALGKKSVEFLPNNSAGVSTVISEQSVDEATDTFRVVLEFEVDPNSTLNQKPEVAGIINLGLQTTDPCWIFSVPVETVE